jgi:hypothetical protein
MYGAVDEEYEYEHEEEHENFVVVCTDWFSKDETIE